MMRRRPSARFCRFFFAACLAAALGALPAACAQKREPARTDRARAPLPERATPQSFAVWRDFIATAPPPHVGCFTAAYPRTNWREVPCRRGPQIPNDVGGKSNDFVAVDTPLVIQAPNGSPLPILRPIHFVEGTFPTVTGVTSVNDSVTTNSGDYSLQINTNRFDTSFCNGIAGCQGFQQFVYASNDGDGTTSIPGHLYIQYWLVNFGANCPASNPPDPRNDFRHPPVPGSMNCFKNGPNDMFLDQFPITQLQNFTLIASTGERDTLIFANSTFNFVYAIANDPGILGLAPHWRAAEFNVFGIHNSSVAQFNDGSSITVSVAMDHGAMAAPRCALGFVDGSQTFTSFTGESNNLNLVGTPVFHSAPLPRVMFTENKSGLPAPSSCGATDGDSSGLFVVYQWTHPSAGQFLTQDPSGELAPQSGYTYDGAPFSLFSQFMPGTTKLYRWLCPNNHHFYTSDENETTDGRCTLEPPLGFIATAMLPGTKPLLRFYNSKTDDHYYTTDAQTVPNSDYKPETSPGLVRPGPGF